jgi:DNA-binding MarR family transcriptional regulator
METRKINIIQKEPFIYFRRILEILGAINPVASLTPSEKDLLAKIMEKRSNLSGITESQKAILILGKDGKEIIAKELGYKKQVLENALTSLRKKKVINDSNNDEINTIIKSLRFNDNEATITFTFKLDV